MKPAGVRIGLLINFKGTRLQDGIKPFVLYPFALFVSFVVESNLIPGPKLEQAGE